MCFQRLVLTFAGLALLWGCKPVQTTQQSEPVQVDSPAPLRRPGLWRQTMLVEGSQGLSVLGLCLDTSADRQLSWWGPARGLRQSCTQNTVEKLPSGAWRFKTVCEGSGGSRIETSGDVVGNFNEKYQLRAETTTRNSPVVELIGTRTISIDAEWQGPCPTDMKPGDARLESGAMVNLLELAASKLPLD